MGYKATVVGGSLNLRANPNTSATIRASIPNGTSIHVKSISGNTTWNRAVYSNKLGYVMKQYLNEYPSTTAYGVEGCDRYGEALLLQGNENDYVVVLQQDLRNYYFHTLSTDGVFGSQTEEAVMEYQQMNGLTSDGIVGTETKSKLYQNTIIG